MDCHFFALIGCSNNSSRSGCALSGTLYVVSLPIGNDEDITLRAVHILKKVDIVAAENPDVARALFSVHGIHTPLTSYHREIQIEKAAVLIQRLQVGNDVALVSDEGTPAICDPGSYLISKARAANISVVPIPGPSALLAALSVAGFTGDVFTFAGYLPRRKRIRVNLLRSLKSERRSLVFFASAHSLCSTLLELHQIIGNRSVLIAFNMTKSGERFFQGRLGKVLASLDGQSLPGEVTVIISGRSEPNRRTTTINSRSSS